MKRLTLPTLASITCLAMTLAAGAERPASISTREKKETAAAPADSYTIEKDIVYARYGTREVMLDLYLPKERPAAAIPCIVVVHGGGWKNGDKQRFARHAAYLASQGFAAACIGYRLLPEVGIPECIQDAKAAVRWVRANASRYRINPDRIGAIGGSAGAHLVAMLGTSYKETKLEGAGGNPGVSSRVQAVVAMAAPTDFSLFASNSVKMDRDMISLVSPINYVDKDSAPLLLLHGEADKAVPMQQSEVMLAKYRAAGASAELIKNPGPHGFWNSESFRETMDRAVAFFREKLA